MSGADDSRRRRWWRRILLPAAQDVLALLVTQGEHTADGMQAFAAWSHGGGHESAVALHAARDAAYDARRDLLTALQAALSTPVDQEDLYTLSERIDRVIDEARHTMREAEILKWAPDEHAGKMGARLADATSALIAGLRLLVEDPEAAGRKSDEASDVLHHMERDYREGMADLLDVEDIRAVLASQDLYRRYVRVGEAVVQVTDRLWYSVLRGA